MKETEMMRPMDKKDKVQEEPVTAGGAPAGVNDNNADEHYGMSIVWATALAVMLVGAMIAILFF